MSRVVQDFTDLLLKKGVISLDQLTEAEEVAKTTSADVGDVLVQMEYATPEEVAEALAKHHKIPYVDLRSAQISDEVVELVPESVARENTVLPFSEEDGALRILIADPFDLETIEKLRFILNRKIETAENAEFMPDISGLVFEGDIKDSAGVAQLLHEEMRVSRLAPGSISSTSVSLRRDFKQAYQTLMYVQTQSHIYSFTSVCFVTRC